MQDKPYPRPTTTAHWLLLFVFILTLLQLFAPYPGWLMVLVGLSSALLGSYAWVWALSRGLRFSRHFDKAWVQVGAPLSETITLHNKSWVPVLWLEIDDASTIPHYSLSQIQTLSGGEAKTWATQGFCSRRGVFNLGPTRLYTSDPLGLFKLQFSIEDTHVLTVAPPTLNLADIAIKACGQADESSPRRKALLPSTTVSGVRDYRPEDGLRAIHWPTTARKNAFFVREFASAPQSDWWLILDAEIGVQLGQEQHNTLEHSIILAASLVEQGLAQSGRAVGLGVFGESLTWYPPAAGLPQRWQIFQALAVLMAGSMPLPQLLNQANQLIHYPVSLVIITPRLDIAWTEKLWPLLNRGLAITVLYFEPASYGQAASNAEALALVLLNMGVSAYPIKAERFQTIWPD